LQSKAKEVLDESAGRSLYAIKKEEDKKRIRAYPNVTFCLFTTTSYTYYKMQKNKKNKQLSSR